VENPLQQREIKITGAIQQNFTISGVFTNTIGYLMMALILAGGLQGISIDGSNDPYPKPLGDGPRSARQKLDQHIRNISSQTK
jgi:hypothetical protein